MECPIPATLFPLLLAVAASAQATLLVGPGGYAQIRDAVAVAAPGDVVVVQPGLYAHFTATVACTIRAQVPGTVDVQVDPAFVTCGSSCWFAGVTVLAPPAGAELHVIGLRFRPDLATYLGQWIYAGVAVPSGTVTFEDCAFGVQGSSPLITALYVDHAVAHLLRCTVDGYPFASTSNAMRAVDADVTLVDCAIVVHAGTFGGTGVALDAVRSRVQGSHLDLRGLGFEALWSTDANVWLADSSLTCQGSACAVRSLAGAAPQLDRCVQVPAPGGPCGAFPAATFLLGARQTTPLQNGAPVALEFSTEPSGLVAVLATTRLGALAAPGILGQPFWLDPSTAVVVALLAANPLGQATTSLPIPAGPTFVGQPLWFEAVGGSSLPLAVAPPTGGLVR